MIIRKSQMSAFEEQMRKNFEDRMVEHLNKFFPQSTTEMGEEAVRQAIRKGMDQATYYFIERECDVARFIDLKFAIHMDFDEHEEMTWARQILDDDTITGEDKMKRIYGELPERLRAMRSESES